MLAVLKLLGLALLLTAAVEAGVAWLIGLRTLRAQAALLLINIATNPALNALLVALASFGVYAPASPFDLPLLLAECFVIIVEAWLLRATLGLPTGKSFGISAACNAASWLAGAFLLG